ncbi:MAG: hypothetical protein DI607_00200 [Sphingomonas hengshuiensis]|nr:MAG: hypothetical protein DI607_00200 [Sphingomonas hengshuiensis]
MRVPSSLSAVSKDESVERGHAQPMLDDMMSAPALRSGLIAGGIWFGRTGLDHASLIGAGGVRLRTFAAIDFLSVPAMSQPLAGAPFGPARS